jgi:hypothetical protein
MRVLFGLVMMRPSRVSNSVAVDRPGVISDHQGATIDRPSIVVDRPGAIGDRQGATIDRTGATTDYMVPQLTVEVLSVTIMVPQ